jgi:hypothetical protein
VPLVSNVRLRPHPEQEVAQPQAEFSASDVAPLGILIKVELARRSGIRATPRPQARLVGLAAM